MVAMLEAFETEARHWCCDRGIDPDGSAPGIMIGPLGFAPEKYWIRRARQLSLAADAWAVTSPRLAAGWAQDRGPSTS